MQALLVGRVLLALAQGTALAPTSDSSSPAAVPAGPSEPGEQDYRIGPNDILRVTVYGYEDLNQIVVVQPGGSFVFPLIGAVPAADATPAEVEKRVAEKLSKGLIRDPKVTVVVQEYRSKTVFVMGEVTHPGAYPLAGNTRLVEILARAGPLSENAGSEAVIVRGGAGAGSPAVANSGPEALAGSQGQVIHVDLRALESGRPGSNVLLHSNDQVLVPRASRIFVSGEVRNPGAFPFNAGLTVRQAVSLAGGPTPVASAGSPRIVREQNGKAETLKVKPDEPLQPGDTVILKARLF